MNAVPVSVALVAGGLAVVNPCGFPLLPAFLSFYLGADERELPRAPTRILQGLLVGALVSIGFLGLFALASLPVSFGVALVARAIPWAGLATGGLLALAGLVALSGRRIALPLHLHIPVKRERRLVAMLLFGVGYGAASLGCTLPLFLTLIAVAREGVARAVRPILPYMSRIAGLLLVIAGAYLIYYWARLRFGNTATVADDPIVSVAIRFSGHIRTFADGRGSTLVAAAGAVVLIALLTALLRWRRQTTSARLVGE